MPWCAKIGARSNYFRCKSLSASRSFESEPRNLFWRNRFKIGALFWKRSFLTNTQAGENGGRCCKTLGERSSIITFRMLLRTLKFSLKTPESKICSAVKLSFTKQAADARGYVLKYTPVVLKLFWGRNQDNFPNPKHWQSYRMPQMSFLDYWFILWKNGIF